MISKLIGDILIPAKYAKLMVVKNFGNEMIGTL
jgi:hypothetical protein